MKSYTDLEQSEKLAEILPLESADMMYVYDRHLDKLYGDTPYVIGYKVVNEDVDFPCWSLTALIESIPQEIFDGEYIIKYTIDIREGSNNRWVLTYEHYENINHSYYGLSSDADNLVDACYEMILKLYERKLL